MLCMTVVWCMLCSQQGVDMDDPDSNPLPPPTAMEPQQAAASQYGRPEVISMALQKKDNSLGLSIVAAKVS